MTITITEFDEGSAPGPHGTGALTTERGNLPLHKLDVRASITGLVSRTELVQGFHNPYDTPLEATYIFPLPDRGAVTAMTMTADGREIVAELQERGQARRAYDDAVAAGQRASIAEEDRPDVFTMRVGNITPGERVEVSLTIVGPLPFEDGEATFRFPLVVAPRYVPGRPIGGGQAGAGWAADTDSVPDASRITPPVLLPGFPNPVDLRIEVAIDPAGLPLRTVRSSLHAVSTAAGVVRVAPGERVDRDFVLRLPYGDAAAASSSMAVVADEDGDEGTFQLTVLPPPPTGAAKPKDVVLLLDRSGSMQGWKMIAARRAAARIVDTLTGGDRFAVLTFDQLIDRPDGLAEGLVRATDRNRFRAVEHLGRADARGGTELLAPLEQGLRLLADADGERDRVLVLVTDGQVGNEDHILAATAGLVHGVRVHTVGIDQAVNAGFLGRLAMTGGGRCELVESEDRLDDAMDAIHRRIAAPLATGLRLVGPGVQDVTPTRLPDVFSGVPLVVRGRYRGAAPRLTVSGTTRDGSPWNEAPVPAPTDSAAIRQVWARSILRDLEDGYAVSQTEALEQRIVATSLRFGVLCRFTAFVAIDLRVSAADGGLHRVVQPVELPGGWEPAAAMPMALAAHAMPMGAAGGPADPAAMSFGAADSAMADAPMPKRVRRIGGRRDAARPEVTEQPGAELAAARTQAAEEARRLEVVPAAEADRRDALDDLATRLDALVRHVTWLGADPRALRELVELLRDETIPTAERWDRARRVLTEFARSAPGSRPAFWKAR